MRYVIQSDGSVTVEGAEHCIHISDEALQKSFNPEEPRDEHGRWTAGSGDALSARALDHVIREHGGFTIHPFSRFEPHSGWMVALPGAEEQLPLSQVRSRVHDYVAAHHSLFEHPNTYLGGWLDKKAKRAYLDVSEVVPERDDAIKLMGTYSQEAVYNLATGEELRRSQVGLPPRTKDDGAEPGSQLHLMLIAPHDVPAEVFDAWIDHFAALVGGD